MPQQTPGAAIGPPGIGKPPPTMQSSPPSHITPQPQFAVVFATQVPEQQLSPSDAGAGNMPAMGTAHSLAVGPLPQTQRPA